MDTRRVFLGLCSLAATAGFLTVDTTVVAAQERRCAQVRQEANLRSGPSENYAVRETIYYPEVFYVYRRNVRRGWDDVELFDDPSVYGYVSNDLTRYVRCRYDDRRRRRGRRRDNY
jgi:hypothetical protein